MSSFQKYWERLKTERPEEYERQLKRNRERIKKLRQSIYNDPEKHKKHKEKQRLRYAKKRVVKRDSTEALVK